MKVQSLQQKKNTQTLDGCVAGKPGHRCGNLGKPLLSFLSRSKLGHLDCFPIAQIKEYIRMVLVWHMSLIRRNQYGIILFLWFFLMLCLLTGLKDVTVSIKKLQSICAAFQSIFSENWNFWNRENCWNCGTHLCAEFWDKAKADAESEAFSPRTHCSKSKFRLSWVLQCLAMNLPLSSFSSFQGMQNYRIWCLQYVVLL